MCTYMYICLPPVYAVHATQLTNIITTARPGLFCLYTSLFCLGTACCAGLLLENTAVFK